MPVKGLKRVEMRQKVQTTSATVFRDTQYLELDVDKELEGNNGYHMTKCASRKLKSEANKANDNNSDDFKDVCDYFEKEPAPKFVTSINRSPFGIEFIEPKSCAILKELKKTEGETVGFLDATGEIARKPFSDSQPLLLHSLIVQLPNKVNKDAGDYGLIGGLLTNRQTQTQIAKMLISVKMNNISIEPVFDHVVSDNSKANINAILAAFNGMSIRTYLAIMWETWTNEGGSKKFTLLHLCVVHQLNQIKNDLKQVSNFCPDVTRNLLTMFCTLLSVRKFEEYEKILTMLLTILLRGNENDEEFQTALVEITKAAENKNWSDRLLELSEKETAEIEECEEIENLDEKQKSIYANSPFYKHALSISQQNEDCTTEIPSNPYYSPEFASKLLEKYIAFAPLLINVNPPKPVSVTKNPVIVIKSNFDSFFRGDFL